MAASDAPGPARPTRRRRLGDAAEARAARYLEDRGWSIVARNIGVGRDELDLIALEPGTPPTLVFVEVRSSSSSRFGAPEERTGADKVARTYRAALALLRDGTLPDGTPLPARSWRVDLLAVDDRAVAPSSSANGSIRHLRGLAPT